MKEQVKNEVNGMSINLKTEKFNGCKIYFFKTSSLSPVYWEIYYYGTLLLQGSSDSKKMAFERPKKEIEEMGDELCQIK